MKLFELINIVNANIKGKSKYRFNKSQNIESILNQENLETKLNNMSISDTNSIHGQKENIFYQSVNKGPSSSTTYNQVSTSSNIPCNQSHEIPTLAPLTKNLQKLADDNYLVNEFIEKMYNNRGMARGIGKIFSFLTDPVLMNSTVDSAMSSLSFRGGLISEVFLSSAIIMMFNDFTIPTGVVFESLFTYNYVITAHFDLMNAWLADRLNDCTVSTQFPDAYNKSNLNFMNKLKNSMSAYGDALLCDRYSVLSELEDRGLLNKTYLNTDKIKSILDERTRISKIRYFPTDFHRDPYSYFYPPAQPSSPILSDSSEEWARYIHKLVNQAGSPSSIFSQPRGRSSMDMDID